MATVWLSRSDAFARLRARKGRGTGLVLVGLALSVLCACGRSDAPAATPLPADPAQTQSVVGVPPDSPQLKQIQVQAVQSASVPTDELVAPARVAVNPNRVAHVVPPVQGRVVRVLAKLGDFVEQGQHIVEIDSPDADAAVSASLQTQAVERQARATLVKADADLARTTDLYQYKAVAEKDLLGARNDLAQARAGLEAAEAGRQQAGRKLELLGLTPGEFHQPVFIRAPISGKVLDVNVAPGEYRAAVSYHSDTTSPLLTIADLSTIWVSADVPEPFLRQIHVGDTVAISLVSLPDEHFVGTVARIGDVIDPQTRTLKVHVELPNARGRLRPEMFGSIRYAGPQHTMPVVPEAAIVQEYGRSIVFLERGPGQFERRDVATGVRVGALVSIPTGLQVGDRVVVDGAILLKGQ
jgi:cobalt-zinc-cadmium efflux system membrane fusion protein